MNIDPSTLSSAELYFFMSSLLVPRPIAWVGSRSPEGVDNLAPFSYFMGVSSTPPAIAISVARGRSAAGPALKDTARNILETRVFTVSIVSSELGEAMVQTGASWPARTSEFEAAGVEAAQGEQVAAPWPAQARVSMECRLIHSHDMGSTHLFVGEILRFHVDDRAMTAGPRGNPLVDVDALDPLGRLGGNDYVRMGERLEIIMPRVSRDEPG